MCITKITRKATRSSATLSLMCIKKTNIRCTKCRIISKFRYRIIALLSSAFAPPSPSVHIANINANNKVRSNPYIVLANDFSTVMLDVVSNNETIFRNIEVSIHRIIETWTHRSIINTDISKRRILSMHRYIEISRHGFIEVSKISKSIAGAPRN